MSIKEATIINFEIENVNVFNYSNLKKQILKVLFFLDNVFLDRNDFLFINNTKLEALKFFEFLNSLKESFDPKMNLFLDFFQKHFNGIYLDKECFLKWVNVNKLSYK